MRRSEMGCDAYTRRDSPDLLGAAEGTLGVDDPLVARSAREKLLGWLTARPAAPAA
jgi:hypothetical protein